MQEYLESMNEDMDKCIESFRKELNTVRTGRATPALLDTVTVAVSAYGATMPLNQLATVTAPDPRLLVVNPWDKSTLGDIERAVTAAGLGFNPSNDGTIIRIPIPALTGDRRQEMVKQVRRYTEDGRVRVRRVRREYNDMFREMEKDKEITEDDMRRALTKVQTATDSYIKTVEDIAAAKEKEVMEV